VADDGPTPCTPPPTAGAGPTGLFEQVMSHGGFLISGIEAVRHLHDDDATDSNSES
jgi:hypothetical protein